MFRLSLSLCSSATASAAATLVLRNIPAGWMKKSPTEVVEFINRVVAAGPTLQRQEQARRDSSDATNHEFARHKREVEAGNLLLIQENHPRGLLDVMDTASGASGTRTVPAGLVPPHIREKWGLGNNDDDRNNSESYQQEELPGLSKYFGKSKQQKKNAVVVEAEGKAATSSSSRRSSSSSSSSKTQLEQQQPEEEEEERRAPAVVVNNVRFVGETSHTASVLVWFDSAAAARRFATHLPVYLRYVGRTRGRGVPASIVGAVPEDDPRLKNGAGSRFKRSQRKGGHHHHQYDEAAENISAAALDVPAADCGLCSAPYRDPYEGLVEGATEAQERQWRKNVAVALFSAVGKRSQAKSSNASSSSSSTTTGVDDNSSNSSSSSEVRLNWNEMLRHHDLGNVGAARAEELAELQTNNPLLAAAADQEKLALMTKRAKAGSDNESSSLSSSSSSALVNSQRSVLPQLSALMYRRRDFSTATSPSSRTVNHQNHGGVRNDEMSANTGNNYSDDAEEVAHNAALEDELAVASEMDIDRYLMSPDVLWSTRKKYMQRRKMKYFDGADTDDHADNTTLQDGDEDDEDDDNVVRGRDSGFGQDNENAPQGKSNKKNRPAFWSDVYA